MKFTFYIKRRGYILGYYKNSAIPNFKFLKDKIKANSNRYPQLRKVIVECNKKKKHESEGRKYKYKYVNYWISGNEDAQKELQQLYKEFYSDVKPPTHNGRVWIADALGGVFVGFYDGEWKGWYGGEGIVRPINKQVLKWWEYDSYKGVH